VEDLELAPGRSVTVLIKSTEVSLAVDAAMGGPPG
jgi:molybdopterin-binding protein